ncbi:MAG: BON domain-containing protein [Xanthomonadales bacterium]|nr:BON domain-containing protein [Xanthomonadales bacterium]
MINPRLVVVILACLVLAGCQPDTPDEKLLKTADDVDAVQQKMEQAGDKVVDAADELAAREKAVEAAESELQETRKELKKIQLQYFEEQELLERRANDTALFRLVQKQLLEEPKLEGNAVSVSVDHGVVSLKGDMQSQQQVDLAVDMAKQAPGVKSVRNLMEIEQSTPQ